MEEMIGIITMFAGNFPPRGWALCDGQLLAINQNQALFSILGTTYGGDGRTTFGLPDFRGRVSMHPGNGPGLSTRRLGNKAGTETNTLSEAQMPNHTHNARTRIPVAVGDYDSDDESEKFDSGYVKGTLEDGRQGQNLRTRLSSSGSSQAVNNVQPFQCVNYIICLQGIFPSRS